MIAPLQHPYRGISLLHLPGGEVETRAAIVTDHGVIEPGFVCDLDSVPRHAGPLYAWFKGRTVIAAIVHDYCYRSGVDRKAADNYFLQLMEWEGVRKRYRLPIYWAVRLFGWAAYQQHRGQTHA